MINILATCESIFRGHFCTIQETCRRYTKVKDLHHFSQVSVAVSDLVLYKIEYIFIVKMVKRWTRLTYTTWATLTGKEQFLRLLNCLGLKGFGDVLYKVQLHKVGESKLILCLKKWVWLGKGNISAPQKKEKGKGEAPQLLDCHRADHPTPPGLWHNPQIYHTLGIFSPAYRRSYQCEGFFCTHNNWQARSTCPIAFLWPLALKLTDNLCKKKKKKCKYFANELYY